MSDKPLFYAPTFKKAVNPTKILPQLLQKQQRNKKSQINNKNQDILFTTQIQKQKKIKKEDNKNYRTKMCPKGRQCKHRFTCRFAHTQQQLRRPFMKRKTPCLLYQRGKCSLGSACREYHGNIDLQKSYKYKQKVCENFINGKCQKGNVCIFIHEKQQNQNDNQNQNKSGQQIDGWMQIQHKINEQQQQQQQNIQKTQQNNLQNKQQKIQQQNNQIKQQQIKQQEIQNKITSKQQKQLGKQSKQLQEFIDLTAGNIVIQF